MVALGEVPEEKEGPLEDPVEDALEDHQLRRREEDATADEDP